MQIYAKDTQNRIITAQKALKSEIYYCIECQQRLAIRKSILRRPHFFHYHHNRRCKSSGKSFLHFQVQNAIKERIGEKKIILEKYFPEIKRIADICWEDKKVIFEVQCSFIMPEEIEARNKDYKKLGYQVVWILHDKKYNQRRISAAEKFLLFHPHYYTNIDIHKKGIIYDTLAGIKYPIALNIHTIFEPYSKFEFLNHREVYWKKYFEGDLLDRYYKNELSPDEELFLSKLKEKKQKSFYTKELFQIAINKYRNFVDYLVEQACQ